MATLLQVLVVITYTSCLKVCKLDSESNVTTNNIIYLLSLLSPPPFNIGSCDPLQPAGDRGAGVLPAAELAIQHVNEDPNTLIGYKVKLINADGGHKVTSQALISFFKHVFYDTKRSGPVAGVLGPTCLKSVIAISSITGRAGLALPNVHIASSAELENRDKYPYTFGVVGSTTQIVKAFFSVIQHNNWTKIAILYDDSFHKNQWFRQRIKSKPPNKYVVFNSAIYNTFFPLESLRKSGANIIAVLTTLTLAHKFLCIGYHKRIAFPEYQWIIVGHRYSEFLEENTRFSYNGGHYECNWDTDEMKNSALDFTLFIHFRLVVENERVPLISGYTYTDIRQQYMEKVNLCANNTIRPGKLVPNVWANTMYDMVWALALAMNITLGDNCFSENSSNTNDEMIDKLLSVDFLGASGHIKFDRSLGFVQRIIDIIQIHNRTEIPAGHVFRGNVSLSNDPQIAFIDSQPRYATVHVLLAVFFILIELTLLLATTTVHIVYLINRRHPSIKASSPSLNHLVFLGCYIWGTVAIVFVLVLKVLGLPDFVLIGNSCHVLLVWLIPMALTLTFGTLMAKTWRIYRIFIHFREPGPLISNKALVMIVLIQLGVDAIIGTVWSIVSPMRLEIVKGGTYINENGETIVPRMCVYPNAGILVPIIVAYKILQIAILFALCLMTRSIKVRNYNTSSLRTASYLCLCLSAVVLPLYGILWKTNAEIHADVVVFCVYFSGIGFILLCFVLLPPALPSIARGHFCHQIPSKCAS